MAGGQRVCMQHFLQILRRIPGAPQTRDIGPDTVLRQKLRSFGKKVTSPVSGALLATVASEPVN